MAGEHVLKGQVLADGPAMEQGGISIRTERSCRFDDMEWL